MAQGRRAGWIVEHARERFGCSVPTIERDMREVRERWAEESAAERDQVRAELGAQIDAALARVHRKGEVRALAALLALKARFHGFLAEKTDAPLLTPEERDEIKAALLARPKADT